MIIASKGIIYHFKNEKAVVHNCCCCYAAQHSISNLINNL